MTDRNWTIVLYKDLPFNLCKWAEDTVPMTVNYVNDIRDDNIEDAKAHGRAFMADAPEGENRAFVIVDEHGCDVFDNRASVEAGLGCSTQTHHQWVNSEHPANPMMLPRGLQ